MSAPTDQAHADRSAPKLSDEPSNGPSDGQSGPEPETAQLSRWTRWYLWMTGLDRWRPALLAILAGLLGALAQAPYRVHIGLIIGFSLAYWLLDAVSRRADGQAPRSAWRAAFAIGWGFGFGYHFLGLYWMAFSFLVQADQFAWMAPIAIIAMPAFLATFWGAAFVVIRALWARRGGDARTHARVIDRALIFVAIFMIAEYARGHVLTGLPWNLPGQVMAAPLVLAQSAALVGVYGLSFVTVLMAISPAAFSLRGAAGPRDPDSSLNARGLPTGLPTGLLAGLPTGLLAGLAVTAGLLALLVAIGVVRLSLNPLRLRDDVAIRIVQPNIPQREKIDPAFWERNIDRAAALSAGPVRAASPFAADATLFVIWPENAAPVIDEVPGMIARVDAALPAGSILLTGAVRRDATPNGQAVYNAITMLAPTSKPASKPTSASDLAPAASGAPPRRRRGEGRAVIGYYDKHHLVPFGEYLPLAGLLRAVGLAQLAPYAEGFTQGAGPRIVDIGPAPFAPLICYEAIFPGALYPRGERPDWLMTVTNDAWFGDSAGPRQHLDQARLRAIESGLPMARAANTGISAVIGPAGRYLDRLALYESGTLDMALPQALARTPYDRVGDGFFWMMVILALMAGPAAGMMRRPSRA